MSADHGWAVASDEGCRCPAVLAGTTDGGQTWAVLSHLTGSLGSSPELRFASATTGYLLTNEGLQVTRDAGSHWTRMKAPAGYLWQLEVARSGATLLTNASGAQHERLCDPCRVFHAPLGSERWTRTLTVSVPGSASLSRSGDLVLVGGFPAGPAGPRQESADSWRSEDGGHSWQKYDDPCDKARFDGEHQWTTGFAVAGRTVVAQCAAFYGMARYQAFTITSTDAGTTFAAGQAAPCTDTFSIGGDGTAVCSDPYTYTVRDTSTDGRTWRTAYSYTAQRRSQDPNASEPLDGCGMQNPHDGRCWLGHNLLTTHDAGHTWQLSRFAPTG